MDNEIVEILFMKNKSARAFRIWRWQISADYKDSKSGAGFDSAWLRFFRDRSRAADRVASLDGFPIDFELRRGQRRRRPDYKRSGGEYRRQRCAADRRHRRYRFHLEISAPHAVAAAIRSRSRSARFSIGAPAALSKSISSTSASKYPINSSSATGWTIGSDIAIFRISEWSSRERREAR